MSETDTSATALDDKGKNRQDVTVFVFAPRNPADKRGFTWSKHLIVGEAAAEAATAFGYGGGQPTLAKGDTVLDRSKQLVAEHIADGDVLELIDAGGGV